MKALKNNKIWLIAAVLVVILAALAVVVFVVIPQAESNRQLDPVPAVDGDGDGEADPEDLPVVITIEELNTANASFDGAYVEFTGEVIGDRIIENIDGSRVWIMLNSQRDANASIAVVMSSADADMIDTFGAYGKTGTTLRVRGYFFVACPEHAGGFDVHAASVDVLAPGSSNPDEFDINAFIPGAIFLGVGILLLALFIYIRERLR
ncbi:MAG: hydrolase [Eggerthellaceae bacterium]|nr:hydrolase [Eggerthellaceae bacterium]